MFGIPKCECLFRFQGGIHEPALLTLSLGDLEQAVYVEKEAGAQQLEAFVCEVAGEANDLMQVPLLLLLLLVHLLHLHLLT